MSENEDQPGLRSFNALRQGVGYLGITFPFVLALGTLILSDDPLQETISHYVGTVMEGVFVGVLFVIGVFFFFYLGYEKKEDEGKFWPSDNLASNAACFFALGVALFPITSELAWVRRVHVIAAIGMFGILAFMSFFVFTKTKKDVPMRPRKALRNRWYRVFGVVIVACMALIGLYSLLPDDNSLAGALPVFWLESIAVLAFGFAWTMKGEAPWLLADEPEPSKSGGPGSGAPQL